MGPTNGGGGINAHPPATVFKYFNKT
jgi:hypothetical protein